MSALPFADVKLKPLSGQIHRHTTCASDAECDRSFVAFRRKWGRPGNPGRSSFWVRKGGFDRASTGWIPSRPSRCCLLC